MGLGRFRVWSGFMSPRVHLYEHGIMHGVAPEGQCT